MAEEKDGMGLSVIEAVTILKTKRAGDKLDEYDIAAIAVLTHIFVSASAFSDASRQFIIDSAKKSLEVVGYDEFKALVKSLRSIAHLVEEESGEFEDHFNSELGAALVERVKKIVGK